MSAGQEGAVGPTTTVGRVGWVDRPLELVLAGLVQDEDELLGNLVEGRAEVASAQGEHAARRWWRGQALRAVPRLVWHDLTHLPVTLLLGLAGFVLWVWVASVAYTAPWFPVGQQAYTNAADPVIAPTSRIVLDTALVGIWNLLAAAVVGATIAALARRARLAPVLVAAALMALISSRHAFYIVYGPGTCTSTVDGYRCSLELGAWSKDVVLPVLWQLPTMMVLLPVATGLGGLAVVAWSRRRARASGRSAGPGEA